MGEVVPPILSAEWVEEIRRDGPAAAQLAESHEALRANAETLASNWMAAEDRANAAEGEAARHFIALTFSRARVEELTAALEFYADPGTYHAVAFFFDPPTGGFDEDFDEEHGDDFYDRPMPGKCARAALKGQSDAG